MPRTMQTDAVSKSSSSKGSANALDGAIKKKKAIDIDTVPTDKHKDKKSSKEEKKISKDKPEKKKKKKEEEDEKDNKDNKEEKEEKKQKKEKEKKKRETSVVQDVEEDDDEEEGTGVIGVIRSQLDGDNAVDSEDEGLAPVQEEEEPTKAKKTAASKGAGSALGARRKKKKTEVLRGCKKSTQAVLDMSKEVNSNLNTAFGELPKLLFKTDGPAVAPGGAKRHKGATKSRSMKLISRNAFRIAASGAVGSAVNLLQADALMVGAQLRSESRDSPWQPIVTKGALAMAELFLSQYAQNATYNASLLRQNERRYSKLHDRHMEFGFNLAAEQLTMQSNGWMAPLVAQDCNDKGWDKKKKKRVASTGASASEQGMKDEEDTGDEEGSSVKKVKTN